jgi:DNA repair protein RecO
VRKPTSKLTGHLLSYIPTQLELLETGGNFLIVQAQVLHKYAEGGTYPENSLQFMGQASLVAEAINRLFTEQEPHPDMYEGLAYTLDRLRDLASEGAGDDAVRLVTAEFLLKALGELGYRPELGECIATGKPLSESFIGWNSQLGGALSEEGYVEGGRNGMVLKQPRALVVLRQLQRPQFVAERLNVAPELASEACQVIYDYLQTQIGQPLRSLMRG